MKRLKRYKLEPKWDEEWLKAKDAEAQLQEIVERLQEVSNRVYVSTSEDVEAALDQLIKDIIRSK